MAERITLAKEGKAEYVEKKSVFIGYAAPVNDEKEALAIIADVKKKHADARHHVYAYHLGGGLAARCSDDGEPQGTAGIPVLDIIRKGGFSDAVIVVTRYFGGILLGAGGLVRAYSAAARLAVEAAGIITYDTFAEVTLRCSYQDHGKLTTLLSAPDLLCDGIEYTEAVTLSLAMPEERLEAFRSRVTELTAGRASLTVKGTRFDCRKLS